MIMMSEGIKSMVSIIVVIVFLYIVFRKRILPVFQKRKIKDAVKPSAPVPDTKGTEFECDILAFDVLKYEDLKDFAQDVSVQLTRKLNYVYMKADLSAVKYLAFGSIFLVVVEWRMKD